MTRNHIMTIIALLICVLAIPAQTTVLEQDNVIEFLLRKVAELEKNQQDCNSFQSRILLELSFVKSKLKQSEGRISELEAIVNDMRSDEYNDNLNLTVEDDPVHEPAKDNVNKSIKEEKNIRVTPEPIGMHSHKPGILSRESRGILTKEVGFCATSSTLITPIHANEIIHFNTVLHNEGNGFNKQTGIFTCPLSGTYFFTVSLMAPPNSLAAVHIMVNGEIKGNSYAAGGAYYDQGSISCIVRCEAGNNVWIGVSDGISIYGENYMSFSGFLLWGNATGSR